MATEPHGLILAVDNDQLISGALAARVAAKLADEIAESPRVVVAPTLSCGHSRHHLPFCGTTSVASATFQQLLVELGLAAVESGFRRTFSSTVTAAT